MKFGLYYYGTKEILGLEEYNFNMKRLYQAKVTTNTAKLIRLNVSVLLLKIK